MNFYIKDKGKFTEAWIEEWSNEHMAWEIE